MSMSTANNMRNHLATCLPGHVACSRMNGQELHQTRDLFWLAEPSWNIHQIEAAASSSKNKE